MNQRYAGIVTAGTNMTSHESDVLDALIRDGMRSIDALRPPANLRTYASVLAADNYWADEAIDSRQQAHEYSEDLHHVP